MQTKDLKNRLVVCVGGSTVRGNVSFDFVDLLEKRLGAKGFQFKNAGVNGDYAYNVLRRVDSVVNLQPDFVTILIGTNDLIATISGFFARITRWNKRLPHNASLEWYRGNLENIVSNLQERTRAKIALLSLSVLGEDLSSKPNQQVIKYNEVIKEIADKYGVNYLPINEEQVKFLRYTQRKAGRAFKGTGLFFRAVLRHSLFRQSFDDISKRNGLLLTIECVHLNSRGGTMIADQIEAFLQSHST
jgi:lysophospholipase L1-like esterase